MENAPPTPAGSDWANRLWKDALGWDEPHEAVRWWVLRAVGLSYLVAFYSLAMQVGALYVRNGLAPVAEYLKLVEMHLPVALIRWQQVPTLFWLDSSDGLLVAAAWAGVGLSVLVCLNIGSRLALPALWVLYLSFVSAGPPFLNFQWDALLLEAGFLAILYAWPDRPSLIFLWLFRWLCFRLIWMNGLVKILAIDPGYLGGATSTWREGTALSFHYFTQPLPAWPAWFFHHLPTWIHTSSTYGVLVLELVLPFAIFLGRWPRLVAAVGFAGLHLLIWVAGSQAFYNLLGLALILPLLDDRWLATFRRCLGAGWLAAKWRNGLRPVAWWRRGLDVPWPGKWMRSEEALMASYAVQGLVAGLILFFSICNLNQRVDWFSTPKWLETVLRDAAPFHITSNYGAFANMTRERPELVIEGSMDGEDWKEYHFHYKPGELGRAPGWAAPFQPRVDWQLWFTALGSPSPWLERLPKAISKRQPGVMALFRDNPFPDRPPAFFRLVKYQYEFTDWDEGWESGDWWKRRRIGTSRPYRLEETEP